MTQYGEKVLDHFFSPRNARRMNDPDAVGKAGEPGRGPFMFIYLKLSDGRILDASYQSYGCAPAIAAGSVLTEAVKGLAVAAARAWDAGAVDAALGGLPAEKMHCAELAASALRDALAQGG